ncbi:hypothetical protein PFISCL1PPCAC_14852, partial [Pristionchus fissidentatus]
FSSLPTSHFEMIHSGIPILPSYETDTLHKSIFYAFDHTKFLYRLKNFVRNVLTVEKDTKNMIQDTDEVIRRHYGDEFPSISVLGRKVFYELANSNLILEEPRLISHRIKFIGGLGYKPAGEIKDKKFLDILDNCRSGGVVLIVFGSQVPSSHFPPHVISAFLHSIRILDEFTFIWKFDGSLVDAPSNLHLVDWLPQNDLLQDSRVVAFISHMGMNSFLESSYSGVPIVAIPLFADQTHNGFNVARLGNGVVLSKTQISNETMETAMRSVIMEEKYRRRAKEIAEMIKLQ